MLSALLVALREGVEAALVVGIVLVYLNRSGRRALKVYAWAGVLLACAASVAAALLLQHWAISEDGFEGLLMLLAAVLVVTMIVWMNRVARTLRKDIERRVEAYAQQSTRAAGWGVGAFVFFMVVREGAELVLILRAVELSSAGVQVWIGTLLGIAIAVGVGFFFFQGTLRIPLHRFFTATSVILMVVAFQLALTGVHELSEAMWIWSSKTEMAWVGPIVRNEVFFFAVILGVAALVVLREWFSARRPAEDSAANPAERRMREWEFRRQRRWSFAAAILCSLVVVSLAAEFAYARAMNAPSPGKMLAAENNQRPHSPFRADRVKPAFLYRRREWHSNSFPGDSPDEWGLCDGSRCLPDMRPGGIPPGRAEHHLPQLRRVHLCSFDWRSWRLQSHPREIECGRGRSDR